METTDYIAKMITVHHISCDICGEHICDSEESDDGYYANPSEFEKHFYDPVHMKRLVYKKQLCEKCRSEKMDEIVNALFDAGFEVEI